MKEALYGSGDLDKKDKNVIKYMGTKSNFHNLFWKQKSGVSLLLAVDWNAQQIITWLQSWNSSVPSFPSHRHGDYFRVLYFHCFRAGAMLSPGKTEWFMVSINED